MDDILSALESSEGKPITATIGTKLAKTANFAEGRAKARAPRRSGFMQDNINAYKVSELHFEVESPAFYSFWVDRGHLTPRGNFVPPTFFFTNAGIDAEKYLEANADELLSELEIKIVGEPGAGVRPDNY